VLTDSDIVWKRTNPLADQRTPIPPLPHGEGSSPSLYANYEHIGIYIFVAVAVRNAIKYDHVHGGSMPIYADRGKRTNAHAHTATGTCSTAYVPRTPRGHERPAGSDIYE
jgi:hypothetical protein